MDLSTLPTEVRDYVKSLEARVNELVKETATLRDNLGIRKFLNPTPQSPATEMDTSEKEQRPPRQTEKKPPPFFLNGIKSTSVLKGLLDNQGIVLEEMKAICNGELKMQPLTIDDCRKLCKLLDSSEISSNESKKNLVD